MNTYKTVLISLACIFLIVMIPKSFSFGVRFSTKFVTPRFGNRYSTFKAQFISPLQRVRFQNKLYLSSPASASGVGSENGEDTVVFRCTKKITDALTPIKIKVTSSNDDPNGSHVQILCVSNEFEGKNVVQRQRLIYKAIWDELSGPVHAVDSIVAKTPSEAGL